MKKQQRDQMTWPRSQMWTASQYLSLWDLVLSLENPRKYNPITRSFLWKWLVSSTKPGQTELTSKTFCSCCWGWVGSWLLCPPSPTNSRAGLNKHFVVLLVSVIQCWLCWRGMSVQTILVQCANQAHQRKYAWKSQKSDSCLVRAFFTWLRATYTVMQLRLR